MAHSNLAGRMSYTFNSLDGGGQGITSSPYQQFNGHREEFSSGGGIIIDTPSHFDTTSSHGGMPDPVDVVRWFEEYIEVISPISEGEEEKLRLHTVEEKWKIIFNEQTREPISAVTIYIDTLSKFVLSTNEKKKHKNSTRRSGKDFMAAKTLSHVLKKLKLDLKMSFDSFVEQFIDDQNNGVQLLVTLLMAIQQEQTSSMSMSKKHRADFYKQTLLDEYDCLLCIKFALRIERGVTQLLKHSDSIDAVALCLMSHFRKTTVVSLEILTKACSLSFGYRQVEDTMTRQRIKFGESVRFKMLISMINSCSHVHFQAVCVRFFNRLWDCHETANFRVYFQQELELAGFNPDAIDKLNPFINEVRNTVRESTGETDEFQYSVGDSPEFEELQKELDIWRKNYINVTTGRQEVVDLENRNSYLREEIDRLQQNISEILSTKKSLENDQQQWKEKCDRYRERAAALQDTVEKLSHLYKEKLGDVPEEEVNLDDAVRPLDSYATVRGLPRNDTSSSFEQTTEQQFEPPPTPAVPPPPPSFLSQTIRRKVVTHVNLPLFNWTPLYSIRKTIFEDIDDEAKLREIDFTDFEAKFRLPIKEESKESKNRREKAIQAVTSKVHFVDINRAKNMIITKKRTGLTAREIRRAIETCDDTSLPGEYAEMLLKYIPTKEELKQLAAHAKEYSRMGEAEQLLFQLAQVDRLESRISTLAFVGIFDELVASVKPKIECIYLASLSVTDSKKLREVFEIILAFGNYMNSSKRGYVLGYKLESLLKLNEIKSNDKSITLMDYLMEVIEKKYPELINFFEEMSITIEKGASYQGIASDLQGLRKGIDLIKYEKDRSHNANPRIEAFHSLASAQVAVVAEAFKKMEEAYKHVCHMFGENYRTMEPDELFKYISDFIISFKNAVAERKAASLATSKATPHRGRFLSQLSNERQSNVVRRSASVKSETKYNKVAPSKDMLPGAKSLKYWQRKDNANTQDLSQVSNEFHLGNSNRNTDLEHPTGLNTPLVPVAKDNTAPEKAPSLNTYDHLLRKKETSSKVYRAKTDSKPSTEAGQVSKPGVEIPNGHIYMDKGSKLLQDALDGVNDLNRQHDKQVLTTIADGGLTNDRRRTSSGRRMLNGNTPVTAGSNGTSMVNGHNKTPTAKYADQEIEALNDLNTVIDNYDGIPSSETVSTAL